MVDPIDELIPINLPFIVGTTRDGNGMRAAFATEHEAALFIKDHVEPIDPEGVRREDYYIDNMLEEG